jgi:hypothetical protein
MNLYIMNPWIKHVKQYMLDHNCSYQEALKLSKESYSEKKEKKEIMDGGKKTSSEKFRLRKQSKSES